MKLGKARAFIALLVGGGLIAALAQVGSGCQQSPTVVAVRSLQRSGKVSFVCLSPTDPTFLPLTDCTAQEFTSICQYEFEDDAGNVDAAVYDAGDGLGAAAKLSPHLYALVTQTDRGEVAVVDTQRPRRRRARREPARAGRQLPPHRCAAHGHRLYAGRRRHLRRHRRDRPAGPLRHPLVRDPARRLVRRARHLHRRRRRRRGHHRRAAASSSWPTCTLQAAPGDILLINDPADSDGNQRRSCDSRPATSPPTRTRIPSKLHGGLARPPQADRLHPRLRRLRRHRRAGSSTTDRGRLVRPLQDRALRPAPVQPHRRRRLPHRAHGSGLPQRQAQHPAVPRPRATPVRPGGLSFADGKLYIGDLSAPVIHVVDMHAHGPAGPRDRSPPATPSSRRRSCPPPPKTRSASSSPARCPRPRC